MTTTTSLLPCDGCGQPATSDHMAKRLARLEATTRFRPVHIGTLLLGAIAPASESDFLYAPAGEFAGEAGKILDATSVPREGRSADAILSEFQRGGFLLTYVLDCPLEPNGADTNTPQHLIHQRLPAVLALIRRSLQPKRIVPISSLLEPMLPEIAITGYPVVLDGTQPFALDGVSAEVTVEHLKRASRA
jgi:hypothetical protein